MLDRDIYALLEHFNLHGERIGKEIHTYVDISLDLVWTLLTLGSWDVMPIAIILNYPL